MKAFNEKIKVNKAVVSFYGAIVTVLFLAYLLELIKKNRTIGYIALFLNTLFVICITKQEYCSIVDKRNVPKEDYNDMISDLKTFLFVNQFRQ